MPESRSSQVRLPCFWIFPVKHHTYTPVLNFKRTVFYIIYYIMLCSVTVLSLNLDVIFNNGVFVECESEKFLRRVNFFLPDMPLVKLLDCPLLWMLTFLLKAFSVTFPMVDFFCNVEIHLFRFYLARFSHGLLTIYIMSNVLLYV